uniref:holo-[acyl-carrier-protein] synthase n=1 Tax=Chenopodium quinoa TaxID=63459 RepID=A0A803NBZ6_CHEQI
MERGVQRWIVDISEWNPSPADFCAAISVLPEHQHSFVYRGFWVIPGGGSGGRAVVYCDYLVAQEVVDRTGDCFGSARMDLFCVKLFLVVALAAGLVVLDDELPSESSLFWRAAQALALYLSYSSDFVNTLHFLNVTVFLQHFDEMRPEFPNFNFSVSHHGDLVAIASEPFCLVGLDVVSPQIPVKETTQQFVNSFSSYFSSKEWNKIIYAGTCDDMLQGLFRYWSLKEAFMKAIGSGLRYQLDSLEFNHINWTRISVKLHSEELRHWKFWHFELKKRHYVSVARGSPHMATENFKRTLKQTDFNEDEYGSGFNLPNASFIWRTVEQLVPN